METRIGPWTWLAVASLAWLPASAVRAQQGGHAAETAQRMLAAAGVRGGLVVHAECGDGQLTAALHAGEGFIVQGLAASPADVDRARAYVQSLGLYGPVSIDRWDGRRLPYKDNLVNLLVVSAGTSLDDAESLRVLTPCGVALIAGAGDQGPAGGGEKVEIDGAAWRKLVKPRPGDIDEWTHYLHDATGNPVSHDAVVGPPRAIEWVGSPRWARHHDHMASMTSLVASGGRLFYIMDEGPTASIQLPSIWRLVARDAFNGTILWKRDIDSWNTRQWPLKSGPAHLTRRLVAVGDRVYVTLSLEAPVTALDAATGETRLTYEGSDRTREVLVSGGVLLALVGLEPSPLPDWRRRDSYVWDNTRRANADWAWGGTPRSIKAYDAASGRPVWQREAPVAPCSLASDAARVIYYDGQKVVCLGRDDGKPLWESEPIEASMPVQTSTGPRTLIYEDVVLFAGNNGKTTALSADDGHTLWTGKQYPSGHQSLRDLLVAGGLVWSGFIAGGGDSGIFTGRDPHTGDVKNEFLPDVKNYWFHHRCYPSKATDQYLMTSRTGIEFIDPAKQHWEINHWVRGGCIYGILPCNGMVYAPMHSCGCYLESKLNGFNALTPGPVPRPTTEQLSAEARLERGPAYGDLVPSSSGRAVEGEGDWPTYRHDPARSGSTTVSLPADLKLAWKADVGGRLSAPVIAGGRVYVASIDTHTLHALDAGTGEPVWSFAAGARIDSPPTVCHGLALFGSTDGYVYALREADGQLAWRFRAAPMDRRMMAFEQLESTWPVPGSVLVHDGVLYCTAGRSIFLDGGIRLVRLNPMTGRLLSEVVMDDRDPDTGEDMQDHVKGLNMPVALADILSCDGQYLYMRSQKIDLEGKRLEIPVENVNEQPAEGSHLFCQIGFLDDSWFHRSFWTFGRRVTGGYGGWYQAGRMVPAGRILVFDDDQVYGYGRKPQYYVNASVLEYQLFAAAKYVTREAIDRIGEANGRMNARLDKNSANSSDWKLRRAFPVEDLTAARYAWTLDQPGLQVRAMVAAGDRLFVAGHPDFIDERRAFRLPDDPEVQKQLQRQADALEGRYGGLLWAVSKADGRPAARYQLDSPPVFDGMAVAEGRLFVASLDGSLLALGDQGQTLRPEGEAEPVQVISDEPAEPDYLNPPEVDKSGDFDKVSRCRVVESKLGYRIRPAGTKQVCLAVDELDNPVSGRVALSAKVMVPKAEGRLTNVFLAFGDKPTDERLVKCGIRYKPQKALIVQGSLTGEDSRSKQVDVDAPYGKVIDVAVEVDLEKQRLAFTTCGATVEAELATPFEQIRYVGIATDSAIAEFSRPSVAPKQ
jgi:outer membrane protein assembly factor BamB